LLPATVAGRQTARLIFSGAVSGRDLKLIKRLIADFQLAALSAVRNAHCHSELVFQNLFDGTGIGIFLWGLARIVRFALLAFGLT